MSALFVWLLAAAAPVEALTVPGDYPSVQAAINAVVTGQAPDGTVITVQPGIYAEALLINTTSRSLTIRGVGDPSATTIDATGKNQSALRVMRATGTIRIEGLTFRGGTAGPGTGGGFTFEDASPLLTNVVFQNNTGFDAAGGVLTRSNAQFSGCTIRANTASRFGGGMVITTGSRPTFTNCVIRDNVSGSGGPGAGSIGSGGGVHVNDASPTFRGSLITGNQSRFAGGGLFVMGLFDSAYGPARVLLEDTEVSNNVSSRFSAADNPAEGGGMHIEDNAVAYLIRTHVTGNSANTGGGLNGYRARYEITSSIIEGNHAPDSLGVGGFGGGIAMTSNNLSVPLRQASSVVLTDSVVRNNDSRVGAGVFMTGDQLCGSPSPSCNPATALRASLQVTASVIDSNGASLYGGGLRLDRTNLTMASSHVFRNSVGASGQSYGGGMLLALGSSASIQDSTFARNSAVNFGGGVFVDDGAILNLTNSNVYANVAGSGGGLYVGSNGPPSGTIQGSTLADNSTYQIHEQACSPLVRTILTYQNNRITPRASHSDLYFSTCGGATSSISSFNGLPSGKASGNTSGTPSFIAYLATPAVGPSVLSWSVSRATSASVTGLGTFSGDTNAVTVAPTATTTYTLTNNGGPSAPAARVVKAIRHWGGPGDTPVPGDFDGDGNDDMTVYRSATGQWFILGSSAGYQTYNWGSAAHGDVPVSGDFDGDAKADVAIFRRASGEWFVRRSSNGGVLQVGWGAPSLGDVPVPADFDGDGKADIAVYRQSSGQWFIRRSSNTTLLQVNWGAPSLGDVPVPADYDGDGTDDVGVYRTTSGVWFIRRSSNGTLLQTSWGGPGDVPVAADYDGDGRADLSVARPTTGEWFVSRSQNGFLHAAWGFGDARVPADFDGDGASEITIWQGVSGAWVSR
jgi:hypothetical protein